MILLLCDYGLSGPYLGEVSAVIKRLAPRVEVINLFPDLPRGDISAAAVLLAAVTADYPPDTVFFCVVDPGVGTFNDRPTILRIDDRWYVGPDNGIFDLIAGQAGCAECEEIVWRPARLARSFHGRDLYAPVCAGLAEGRLPETAHREWRRLHVLEDDPRLVVYIDGFGNAFTGIRARTLPQGCSLRCGSHDAIRQAGTFAEVPRGGAFWHENSCGLAEIAVNQGSAAEQLNIKEGDKLEIIFPAASAGDR